LDVYFTTVIRGAPVDHGGELVWLNWATKTVRKRVPIAPTNPSIVDPNPRGNSRGGRGIALRDGSLLAATYHSLLAFDRKLEPLGRVDNHNFVGLHEVSQDGGIVWTASTSIDAAIAVDESGRTVGSWWARETPRLQQLLKLTPGEIDKSADNRLKYLGTKHAQSSHTHLNAATWHDGQLFVLLNRFGVVYNATRDELLVHRPEMRGAHNLVFTAGRMLVNDTQGRKLVVFDPKGTLVREIDLLGFPVVRDIFKRTWPQRLAGWLLGRVSKTAHFPRPIFVRGLYPSGPGRVLVGFSPASIIEIDLERGEVVDSFQYSGDLGVCVHGLVCAPD